jgi:hypothetical protein
VRELIDARVLPAGAANAKAQERRDERVKTAVARGVTQDEVRTRGMLSSAGGYGGGGGGFTDVEALVAKATPVAARLSQDGRYDEGFRLAFGDSAITPERVGDAIESYVLSLRSTENALDRHLAGKEGALSPSQERGLALFSGKASCAQCHSLEVKDGRAALTDGSFHDTGVGFDKAPDKTVSASKPKIRVRGRGDRGRGGATLIPDDDSSFKTPSLRDVARRAPYMHDASLATLEDVVSYYDKGGTPNPHLDSRIKPLSLSAEERGDLVAFLHALTGDERPGLGAVPEYRRRRLEVTIEDLEGRRMAKLPVRVVPCGDRLRGTTEMPEPIELRTADDGTISFEFPKSTHVRLESPYHEIGLTRPIPDSVATTTLFATPLSVVSVRLRRANGDDELPPVVKARPFGPRSQGAGETSGDSFWTLTRSLRLSADEAIYTTPAAPGRGAVVVRLATGGDDTDLGHFAIDLSGGASEPIDLRTAEDQHPEVKVRRFEK